MSTPTSNSTSTTFGVGRPAAAGSPTPKTWLDIHHERPTPSDGRRTQATSWQSGRHHNHEEADNKLRDGQAYYRHFLHMWIMVQHSSGEEAPDTNHGRTNIFGIVADPSL